MDRLLAVGQTVPTLAPVSAGEEFPVGMAFVALVAVRAVGGIPVGVTSVVAVEEIPRGVASSAIGRRPRCLRLVEESVRGFPSWGISRAVALEAPGVDVDGRGVVGSSVTIAMVPRDLHRQRWRHRTLNSKPQKLHFTAEMAVMQNNAKLHPGTSAVDINRSFCRLLYGLLVN